MKIKLYLSNLSILILSILFFSFKSENRPWKAVLPFEQLVYQSELIVNGEIAQIDSMTYQFEISKVVKGNHHPCDEIIVEKWHEWPSDIRGIDHAIGQQIILFLKKDESSKESWKIINGSTGEKILQQDNYWIYHKSKVFHAVDIVEKYFEKVNDWRSKINCSTTKMIHLRSDNPFFNHIVSEMEREDRIE